MQENKTARVIFDPLLHGGSWLNRVMWMRSTYLARAEQYGHAKYVGFRLIRGLK